MQFLKTSKYLYRALALLMLLMSTASQANVMAMACADDQPDSVAVAVEQDMAAMHAGHNMAEMMADVEQPTADTDCCGADCQCPTVSCSSVMAIVNSARTSPTLHATELHAALAVAAATHVHNSLFRPPISA